MIQTKTCRESFSPGHRVAVVQTLTCHWVRTPPLPHHCWGQALRGHMFRAGSDCDEGGMF